MNSLRVFGPLELTYEGGKPVSGVIAQPKRLALLVYLALARPAGMQRRDSILALLWPDSTEERARHALNQSLSVLRRELPNVVLTRGLEEIGTDRATLQCDVVDFEAELAAGNETEALALYRGDLLPGFNLSEVPEFERWLESERTRLRREAVGAAMSLSREALAAGDTIAAKTWASRATHLAPDDERVLRSMLEVFDRSGDRAGAVRHYEDFARELRSEYQTEPSPETRALLDRIKSREVTNEHGPQSGVSFQTPHRGDESPSGVVRPTQRRRVRERLLAGMFAAILLAAAIYASLRKSSPAPIAPASIGSRIVAVPFENRSGDPALTAVGAIASDWITQGLLETHLLNVVDGPLALAAARNIAASGAHSVTTTHAIAEETQARLAITGSVIRAGDSLALQAKVSDLQTGEVLAVTRPAWAPVNNSMRAIAKIRDLVIGALALRLDERLASQESALSARQPPTLAAYEEYLTGLQLFFADQYKESIPHFSQAYAKDSAFTLPLLWKLIAYGNSGDSAGQASMIRALRKRPLALDPADRLGVEYYSARLKGDYPNALTFARSAAQLAPQSVWAWNHVSASLRMNRPAEALAALKGLDPEHGWLKSYRQSYYGELAIVFHTLGDYQAEVDAAAKSKLGGRPHPFAELATLRALAAAGKFGEVRPRIGPLFEDSTLAGFFLCVIAELRTHKYPIPPDVITKFVQSRRLNFFSNKDPHGARGREQQFLKMLYETRQLRDAASGTDAYLKKHPGSVEILGLRGVIAQRMGNRALADSIYQRLSGMRDDEGWPPNPAFWQMRIASVRGDGAAAFAQLRRGYALGMSRIWGYADPVPSCSSDYDGLRGYPPFRAAAAEGMKP